MQPFWFVLALGSAILQLPGNEQGGSAASPERVEFCQLIRKSELYDGKTIILKATYGGGIEGSVVFDEACRKTTSEDNVITLAAFSPTEYRHGTPVDKKFQRLLKKGFNVNLTVRAIFVDGKTRVFGHLNCCRYRIEIQELMDVEAVH